MADEEKVDVHPATNQAAPQSMKKKRLSLKAIVQVIGAASSLGGLVGLYFIYDTLNATKDSTREANRAWVEVEDVDLSHIYDGSNNWATLKISNVGREPAQNVELSLDLLATPIKPDEKLKGTFATQDPCVGATMYKKGIIFPDNPVKSEAAFVNGSLAKGHLDDQHNALLRAGKLAISIYGCVNYVTYGATHHTRYCYFSFYDDLSKDYETRRCPNTNTAD